MLNEERIAEVFNQCITNSDCCIAENCTNFTDLLNCTISYFTAEVEDSQQSYGTGKVTEIHISSNTGLLPGITTTVGLFIPPHDGKGYWELVWDNVTAQHPIPIGKIIFHHSSS